MGRVAAAAIAGVVLLTAGAVARAAKPPEVRANELYRKGKKLMARGELARAVDAFTDAWKAFKHPLIMKKRAECHERLQRYGRAIDDYRTYVGRLKGNRKKRSEARLIRDRIRSLKALMKKEVEVTISSKPPGVFIELQGRIAKATPFQVKLSPGVHKIRVRDKRFTSEEETIQVVPGPRQLIDVPVSPRLGQVVVTVNRETFKGVEVTLDAKPLKLTTPERRGPRTDPRTAIVGKHVVVCTMAGRENAGRTFEVTEGQEVVVACDFVEPQIASHNIAADPWGWVTVVAAVGCIGAGTGLLISFALDVQKAEDTNQELVTNKHIFGGVFLGAGVALAIGSYFVFTRDRGPPSTSERSGPTLLAAPLPGGGLGTLFMRF